MENKLNLPLKKKKNEAESPRLDPLMRALKALHGAGAPETMTEEELEHQRRSQEVLGRLTAPMAGMDYEEFSLGGMNAAWMRLKAPHGSRHAILYCHGGGVGMLGRETVFKAQHVIARNVRELGCEHARVAEVAARVAAAVAVENGVTAAVRSLEPHPRGVHAAE